MSLKETPMPQAVARISDLFYKLFLGHNTSGHSCMPLRLPDPFAYYIKFIYHPACFSGCLFHIYIPHRSRRLRMGVDFF